MIDESGVITRIKPARCTRVGKIMTPWSKDGYPAIALRKDGRYIKSLVHILVCEAFHGPKPSPRHEVAHNDGNPANCHADNLRWATPEENQADKKRHGTNGPYYTKLTEDKVREIRSIPKGTMTGREIAKHYGVSEATISMVRNPNASYWKDVDFPSPSQGARIR